MSKLSEHKDSLQFYRTNIARIIPKELIENIKHCTFTPHEFYKYQESQFDPTTGEYNDNNILYVLADKEKKVKGFFWGEINGLDGTLFLNTMSVDKSLWNRGEIVTLFLDLVKKIAADRKCRRTFWITTNPKFYAKFGFKASKNVIMEYQGMKLAKKIEDKFEKAYNNKKEEE